MHFLMLERNVGRLFDPPTPPPPQTPLCGIDGGAGEDFLREVAASPETCTMYFRYEFMNKWVTFTVCRIRADHGGA